MSLSSEDGFPELCLWALDLMNSREPDFIIGERYLERWHVVPRNKFNNVYLHRINKSDDDRALHDHPWDNTTIVVEGSYIEVMPSGDQIPRYAGDIIHRKAPDAHRLIIEAGKPAVTLFLTGPVLRTWGFHCPKGWVTWYDFVSNTGNQSLVGKGCGE